MTGGGEDMRGREEGADGWMNGYGVGDSTIFQHGSIFFSKRPILMRASGPKDVEAVEE